MGTTKDGTEYYKPPVRLCDPLEIVGRGQGADEGEYRVIEYLRHGISGRAETKQAAFPLEIVGTREGWALLRGFGIGVNQNGATLAALAARYVSGVAVWACGSTHGIASLVLPDNIREVAVIADNDAAGTGIKATYALQRRYHGKLDAFRIWRPDGTGADALDVVTANVAKGAAA